jgi:OFA family oxalate/formate antiporter-like MFS transporter
MKKIKTIYKTKLSDLKLIYVLFGVVIFICLGTVYSWSVFRTPLIDQFQLSENIAGLPYTVFLMMYTLFMLVSGKIVDRYNPRLIIVIGGLMVGLGWILSGFATSFNMIIICYGFLSGAGVGIVYGVPIKVISSWFDKNQGLALGVLLSGFGLSPFITAPLNSFLIDRYGVNHTFIIVGSVFIILIPLLGLFMKKNNKSVTLIDDKKRLDNKADQNIKVLLTNKVFWGLWLCFTVATAIGLSVIGISSQIGVEVFLLDAKTTAFYLGLFAVFNAGGRPLFGWLTNKFSVFTAALISFLLILCASLFIFTIDATYVYVISLSIIWMCLGAWLSIAPTATALLFDQTNYSRNYGVLFTAYGVGAFIGSPLVNYMKSQYGSYKFAFIPIIFLAIIGLVIAFLTLKNANQE